MKGSSGAKTTASAERGDQKSTLQFRLSGAEKKNLFHRREKEWNPRSLGSILGPWVPSSIKFLPGGSKALALNKEMRARTFSPLFFPARSLARSELGLVSLGCFFIHWPWPWFQMMGAPLLKGFILHLRFRYLFNNGTKLRIFWREIIKAYFPGQSTLLVKSDLIGLEAFTGIRNKEPCLLSQCGCSPMHFNLETFSENEKRTKINFKNSRIACTMIFGFNLFYDITILPYNMRKLTPVLVCWRSNHMDKKG